jgi:hypothetical protein
MSSVVMRRLDEDFRIDAMDCRVKPGNDDG